MARVYVRLPSDTYLDVGGVIYDRNRSIGGNEEEYTVRLPDNTQEYTVTRWFDIDPTFENGLTSTRRVAATVVFQVGANAAEIDDALNAEADAIREDINDWSSDEPGR